MAHIHFQKARKAVFDLWNDEKSDDQETMEYLLLLKNEIDTKVKELSQKTEEKERN